MFTCEYRKELEPEFQSCPKLKAFTRTLYLTSGNNLVSEIRMLPDRELGKLIHFEIVGIMNFDPLSIFVLW